MPRVSISAGEKRWRAEDDARALRIAQEIQNDPRRVKEAKKVINEQLNDLTKVATSIEATKKPASKTTTTKKSTTKKSTTKKRK